MALPRVTPGTYNYGAYANPKEIKYNATGDLAMGEAISQGLLAAGQLGAQAIKKRADFNEETYKNTALLEAEKREDFHAKTTQRINDISEEYSAFRNPKASRQLKRQNPEKFYAEELRYKNEIDSILAMDKLDIDPEILDKFTEEEIRDIDKDKFYLAKKLSKSDYYLKEVNGRTHVAYEDESGAEQTLLLSDVVDNIDNYTDFSQKFSFNSEEQQQNIIGIAEIFNKTAQPLFTSIAMNEREALSYQEAFNTVKKMPSLNAYIGRIAERVSDDIGMSGEELINFVADQVVKSSKQFGDKIKPDTSAIDRYKAETERIKALKLSPEQEKSRIDQEIAGRRMRDLNEDDMTWLTDISSMAKKGPDFVKQVDDIFLANVAKLNIKADPRYDEAGDVIGYQLTDNTGKMTTKTKSDVYVPIGDMTQDKLRGILGKMITSGVPGFNKSNLLR
jgi:hypothetical protein